MKITPEKIQAAVKKRVEEAFPGETVYEDLVGRSFARPCNLVELTRIELDPLSLGAAAVSLRCQYKLTTFCQVDEVHNSHLPVLDLRAMLLLAAFAPGYLRVEDRALKVQACTAETGLYDAAEVTLTLALTVDRREFLPEELYELMKDITIRYTVKEETSHE